MSKDVFPELIDRRRRQGLGVAMAVVAGGLFAPLAGLATPSVAESGGQKVLRYALRAAETGFDPAPLSDLYSRIITSHLFEGLYTYDHLARPPVIKPLTADGMPEASADFKVFTIKLKPGIFFADDPAFKGGKRELVAEDFIYAFKRFADPANKAPSWSDLEELNIVGLNEARDEAIASHKPFDYDKVLPGFRALDRHTLRIELKESRPRLIESLADSSLRGAVAREVVEFYGDQIAAHPVGTGPFILANWRRSSLITLARNPAYRERFYDAQPAADDAEGQALLARFKGRRLPMIDRVEVAIIEEPQPRWLSFLNQEYDFIERVPEEYISQAMPAGKVAANLAKHGVQGYRSQAPDIVISVYNMEDPVVGGYTPERIALRRAMNLAMDIRAEIDIVRRGQGYTAQSPFIPNTSGYDPKFKSEMGDYDPARSKALLDLYGYLDRDGDGWREQPDGSPLRVWRASQTDQLSRALDERWQRDMKAIGIRAEIRPAQWPENLRAVQAGSLMMWWLGISAAQYDGQSTLGLYYGPQAGSGNYARFKNEQFDALYRKALVLPDGPEREALFVQAKRIAVAYAPYKIHLHRYITDMARPWIVGYRRPVFWNDWWQYVDVDDSQRKT
ncbi:ABC transporter substrate-binding protein [Ideonella azotifigens]|uniref:ABC transporter substrate-binding protein n=1 Tax=Ideonella azotifigens TaxID=513160 RepID=A0ABN1JN57_9BURK|nr:ABC transporter substrate-binding protein [Ideonella azotifigens]MCD2339784.1 ABC transporter substrate-binding protein [Ideonella azotifigens]